MSQAAPYNTVDYSRDRRRHGLGWVPWVALALLALIILASLLISRNASDSGDNAGVDLTNDPAGQSTPAAPAAGATGSTGSTTTGQNGIYTSTGTDVLGASSSEVGALAGSAINGNNVTVRSVVADEGFWVSSSGSEQMYVYLSQQARQSAGESAPQVRAGQRVDFAGTLARVPADVGDLGLTASEGAGQLRSQGVFVDATSFRIR